MTERYTVFNASQVEGLPEEFYEITDPLPLNERYEAADQLIKSTGATFKQGGKEAFFDQKADYIQMPNIRLFVNTDAYYSTLLHELAHWTGADNRLTRTKGKAFDDEDYAFEELVAELTASFVCASFGFAANFQNSVALAPL